MRRFLSFFLFEVLAVIVAMGSFRVIDNRLMAAALAGAVFVLVGLAILINGLRDARFRMSFTFLFGLIHLFVVALPLMIVRFMNTASQFNDVKIWGLPGPTFHQISGVIYWCLMIGTLTDALISWWRCRRGMTTRSL